MRKLLVAALAVTALSGCTTQSTVVTSYIEWPLTSQQTAGRQEANVTIGATDVTLAIADTDTERSTGLGNVTQLPNDGMLFVFDVPDRYTIWMKDTLIPLDIVWLRNGVVVHTEANVQPEPGVADSQLRRYTPTKEADAIIEVAPGFVAANGLKVGSTVELRSLR